MATSEKRWQLLLVADDGRIIPFKRIKGLVVTLAILLVALGLICAGLGWQLTAEKVRHGRTQDQLADANHQLDRYKSENELITAELVLGSMIMFGLIYALLFALWVFLLNLFLRRSGHATTAFWIANLIAALAFAAGHLDQ